MPEWTMRKSQRGFREVGGGIEEKQKGRREDVSTGAALATRNRNLAHILNVVYFYVFVKMGYIHGHNFYVL